MNTQTSLAQELIQGDANIRCNFGIEVLSAHQGVCELELVVTHDWVNGAGFTHGSVAYAMMDSACAYACGSLDVLGLTTSGNVTYVRGYYRWGTYQSKSQGCQPKPPSDDIYHPAR